MLEISNKYEKKNFCNIFYSFSSKTQLWMVDTYENIFIVFCAKICIIMK